MLVQWHKAHPGANAASMRAVSCATPPVSPTQRPLSARARSPRSNDLTLRRCPTTLNVSRPPTVAQGREGRGRRRRRQEGAQEGGAEGCGQGGLQEEPQVALGAAARCGAMMGAGVVWARARRAFFSPIGIRSNRAISPAVCHHISYAPTCRQILLGPQYRAAAQVHFAVSMLRCRHFFGQARNSLQCVAAGAHSTSGCVPSITC